MISDLEIYKELSKNLELENNIPEQYFKNFPYQIFIGKDFNRDLFKEDFYVKNKDFILEEHIKEFDSTIDISIKVMYIIKAYVSYVYDINRPDLFRKLLFGERKKK